MVLRSAFAADHPSCVLCRSIVSTAVVEISLYQSLTMVRCFLETSTSTLGLWHVVWNAFVARCVECFCGTLCGMHVVAAERDDVTIQCLKIFSRLRNSLCKNSRLSRPCLPCLFFLGCFCLFRATAERKMRSRYLASRILPRSVVEVALRHLRPIRSFPFGCLVSCRVLPSLSCVIFVSWLVHARAGLQLVSGTSGGIAEHALTLRPPPPPVITSRANNAQGPVIVACPDGGTSIEDLAESNPELIMKVRSITVSGIRCVSVCPWVGVRFRLFWLCVRCGTMWVWLGSLRRIEQIVLFSSVFGWLVVVPAAATVEAGGEGGGEGRSSLETQAFL